MVKRKRSKITSRTRTIQENPKGTFTYKGEPEDIIELFVKKLTAESVNVVKKHVVDVAKRTLDLTSDLELATFALFHQEEHQKINENIGEAIGLLNPYDFEDYRLLQTADDMEDVEQRIQIYGEIIQRRPHLLLLRAIDLASVAEYSHRDRVKLFRKIEPRTPLKAGFERIEKSIAEIYSHVVSEMGSGYRELLKDLEIVRMTISYPRLMEKCKTLLGEHISYEKDEPQDYTIKLQLIEIERMVKDFVLPRIEGDILDIISRRKRPGSLANKLIEKMKEIRKPTDERAVIDYFFKKGTVRLTDRGKELIKDLVGFEVTVENGRVTNAVNRITRKLRPAGFTEVKVDERRKEIEIRGERHFYEVYYVTAKAPDRIGGHWIEIQVQTDEMQEEKKNGVFYHAGYKGWLLDRLGNGNAELKYIQALAKAIETRKRLREYDNLENLERKTHIAEIKEIMIEEKGEHIDEDTRALTIKTTKRIMEVPFPGEVKLIDIIARTVGVRSFTELQEFVVEGDFGTIPGQLFSSFSALDYEILQMQRSTFEITLGQKEDLNREIGAFGGKFNRQTLIPETLSGLTQVHILKELGKIEQKRRRDRVRKRKKRAEK